MERNMEMAFIIIQLEENLEVNGSKIRKMDTESFNMLIMIDTKAIGWPDNDQEKELMNTQMEIFTKANGWMI
jgi:hypothetical protein